MVRIDNRDHYRIQNFNIKLNKDIVLHMIDCHKDSPVFEDVNNEYNKLETEVYRLVEPVVLIKFENDKEIVEPEKTSVNASVIYILITIGDDISKLSSKYFEDGDYLGGMLINAMANQYLFQMEETIENFIREKCEIRGLGVKQRLEVPVSLSMESNKQILKETRADEELNMGITEGYMFSMLKTNAYILLLTEDDKCFNLKHNCDHCEDYSCNMRNINKVDLQVIKCKDTYTIRCEYKESIMKALIRHDIYMSSICGGKGSCGKCSIQVVKGKLDITKEDKKTFTTIELESGYRLSCMAFPQSDCIIRLITGDETDFDVLSNYQALAHTVDTTPDGTYTIGIDIGTTTIAMNLVEIKSKAILKTYTSINKQRSYGADVILRMKASNEGKNGMLQESIRKDLLAGIRLLVDNSKISKNHIKNIAIACNTTMSHLLLGYSCETLGIHPYTPVNISRIEKPFKDIFATDYLNIPVIILPGISTFVGGDIIAGLLVCDFVKTKEPCLLIDLGTNGEMAIGNMDRILVSSAAAGPAFEGGNITCGIGSVAGAICEVSIKNNKVYYKTIADKDPIGICGTGVIEIISELLKENLIDETGLLDDSYFDTGYEIAETSYETPIIITQMDIREIQLAKAAIRAGIEVLLDRYGVTYDQIDKVWLAGGFGYKLNIEKAINIGLLPREFAGKVQAIGNSSLAGAVKYILDYNASEDIEKILAVAEEVSLSIDKGFNDLYVQYMSF